MKKLLLFILVLAVVVYLPAEGFAADLSLGADGQWAEEAGKDSSNVANAVTGDNVDINGWTLSVTNDGTADDGWGVNAFGIGAITDSSSSGSVNIYTTNDATMQVQVSSVDIGSDFTVTNNAAVDNIRLITTLLNNLNVGGEVVVSGSDDAEGAFAFLLLNGAINSAERFTLSGPGVLYANGTISGPVDGGGTGQLTGAILIGEGASAVFEDAIGANKSVAMLFVHDGATVQFNEDIHVGFAVGFSVDDEEVNPHSDGIILLADGKYIYADMFFAENNGEGTLTYLGASATQCDIGVSGEAALKAVNLGNGVISGGVVILGHDINALATTVNKGATLRLSGDRAITGNLVTVAVADAAIDIGANTLTVGGNYTMGADSQLALAITDAANYGSVTATGDVTVPDTVAVDVNVIGYIANGTTFLVVDGSTAEAGAVAGGNTVTDNNPYVSFTATGGDSLTLAASRDAGFNDFATSSNSSAIGSVLEDIGSSSPTSDMSVVLDTLESLSTGDVESALAQMEPKIDSGVVKAASLSGNHSVKAVTSRLEARRSGTGSGISTGDLTLTAKDIWAKGFGTYAKQDTRQGIAGYTAYTGGAALGIDLIATENSTTGASLGYAYNKIKSKSIGSGRTTADSVQGALYYGYSDSLGYAENDMFYVDLVGSLAWNSYKGSRAINFGGINRQASAGYDGWQYGLYAESGYQIPLGAIDFTPLASLQYMRLNLDSYTETGAGALSLSVDRQSYDLLELGLGAKITSRIEGKAFDIVPGFRAKWLYDFMADRMETTSRFTGGGASFQTRGARPARNSLDLGLSLSFIRDTSLTIDLDYDFNIKQDFTSHNAAITAKYSF